MSALRRAESPSGAFCQSCGKALPLATTGPWVVSGDATPTSATGTSFWTGRRELKADSPKARGHVELLMATVAAVEALLSHTQAGHEPITRWDQIEHALREEGRRRHLRGRIWLFLAIGFVVLMVTLLIVTLASL